MKQSNLVQSVNRVNPSSCFIVSMAVAYMTVVTHTHWFCWPNGQSHFSCNNWCALKMDLFFQMNSTTSTATIQVLRTTFSQHGLPESIMLDNGPQFASSEFAQFCHLNGIHHTKVPPYHPSLNGLWMYFKKGFKKLSKGSVVSPITEWTPWTCFKKGFKKLSKDSVQYKISHFLFSYCITPETSTGISPAELLMGRILWSCLHLLNSSVSQKNKHKQEQQKLNHDKKAVERMLRGRKSMQEIIQA